jgi:hypothetical protein
MRRCPLWYYWSDVRRAGPFTSTALREMIRNGQLDPSHIVWQTAGDKHLYVRADTASQAYAATHLAAAEAQQLTS